MATERAAAKCVWKRIIQINQSFASKFERYCGLTWPGWIRISIWTATVVVLTGLMARELSSNVDKYVSNNLGVSGFTLCALLFFLVDSINRWRQLRPNSDQQSNPSPAILGLHLFWFTRLLQTSSTKDATQDNSQGQHEDYTKKLLEKLAQDMAEMKENFTTLTDRMNAWERKSKG